MTPVIWWVGVGERKGNQFMSGERRCTDWIMSDVVILFGSWFWSWELMGFALGAILCGRGTFFPFHFGFFRRWQFSYLYAVYSLRSIICVRFSHPQSFFFLPGSSAPTKPPPFPELKCYPREMSSRNLTPGMFFCVQMSTKSTPPLTLTMITTQTLITDNDNDSYNYDNDDSD